ncbi:uncharacterized protein LOC116954168 isoform X2 [Petromyzon marinus]|uniref:uncharacterized protein LOC116954168 isoform X2 n=1 Tax=Petromyzon marinus TaxID=7757 RepID=UPI003F6EB95C
MSKERPKRHISKKRLEYNHGILWWEERYIQKALYRSLRDERGAKKGGAPPLPTRAPHAANTAMGRGKGPQLKAGSLSRLARSGLPTVLPCKRKRDKGREGSPAPTAGAGAASEEGNLRKKLRAQRKFAQSQPGSPGGTPVKAPEPPPSAPASHMVDVCPKRPKTEDFLTFLCLRGTHALPRSMELFGRASDEWDDEETAAEEASSSSSSTSSASSVVAAAAEVDGEGGATTMAMEESALPASPTSSCPSTPRRNRPGARPPASNGHVWSTPTRPCRPPQQAQQQQAQQQQRLRRAVAVRAGTVRPFPEGLGGTAIVPVVVVVGRPAPPSLAQRRPVTTTTAPSPKDSKLPNGSPCANSAGKVRAAAAAAAAAAARAVAAARMQPRSSRCAIAIRNGHVYCAKGRRHSLRSAGNGGGSAGDDGGGDGAALRSGSSPRPPPRQGHADAPVTRRQNGGSGGGRSSCRPTLRANGLLAHGASRAEKSGGADIATPKLGATGSDAAGKSGGRIISRTQPAPPAPSPSPCLAGKQSGDAGYTAKINGCLRKGAAVRALGRSGDDGERRPARGAQAAGTAVARRHWRPTAGEAKLTRSVSEQLHRKAMAAERTAEAERARNDSGDRGGASTGPALRSSSVRRAANGDPDEKAAASAAVTTATVTVTLVKTPVERPRARSERDGAEAATHGANGKAAEIARPRLGTTTTACPARSEKPKSNNGNNSNKRAKPTTAEPPGATAGGAGCAETAAEDEPGAGETGGARPTTPAPPQPSAPACSRTRASADSPGRSARSAVPPAAPPSDLSEIPTLRPSSREFQDPVAYVESMRGHAEAFGACRVVPPADWRPECKLHEDMRFVTRVQHVHKLGQRWGPNAQRLACIRKHLLAQGIALHEPPVIGGCELDLARFSQLMGGMGGVHRVVGTRPWSRLADQLRVPRGAQDRLAKLQEAYCKYLLAYDCLAPADRQQLLRDVLAEKRRLEQEQQEEEGAAAAAAANQQQPAPGPWRRGRSAGKPIAEPRNGHINGAALRRGATAAAAVGARSRGHQAGHGGDDGDTGLNTSSSASVNGTAGTTGNSTTGNSTTGSSTSSSTSTTSSSTSSSSSTRRRSVDTGRGEETAPGREAAFLHGLQDCVLKGKSVTLTAFYRMARNTVAMCFSTEEPAACEVEQRFWQLVEERDAHVAVHCGKVDTKTSGSGFPVSKSDSFSRHGWNLTVLPSNPASVLRHLGTVSGVTVPWLNIGMIYSTSSWAQDPHLLPSIDFLHTGADKIWYSIPAGQQEALERAVLSLSPANGKPALELLQQNIVSPEALRRAGVRVHRAVQRSGEFLVVFPGACTANVSCGYSVSEAVPFATAGWLPTAWRAAQTLRERRSPNVFAVEKLLYLAAVAELERENAAALGHVAPLLQTLRDVELRRRRRLFEAGLRLSARHGAAPEGPHAPGSPMVVRKRVRRSPGEPESPERRCQTCRQLCYLSMVVQESDGTVFCLECVLAHVKEKKTCRGLKMMYRYDEEQINSLVYRVTTAVASGDGTAASPSRPKRSSRRTRHGGAATPPPPAPLTRTRDSPELATPAPSPPPPPPLATSKRLQGLS